MATVSPTEAFQDKINCSIAFLESVFPRDPSLASVKATIAAATNLAGSAASRSMMETYLETGLKYIDEIERRDDDFFIKLAQSIPAFAVMDIAGKWSRMNIVQRTRVWDDCHDLLAIAATDR